MTMRKLPYNANLLHEADGYILTSQRAAYALKDGDKQFPVFATGDKTATAAQELGHHKVISAGGNWRDLAQMILSSALLVESQTLCHLSGSRQRGELGQTLIKHGLNYRRVDVYEMQDLTSPTVTIKNWLDMAKPGAILFYSPASAEVWAKLDVSTAQHIAICISNACANALDPDRWRRIAVAEQPNEQALWHCLKHIGFP